MKSSVCAYIGLLLLVFGCQGQKEAEAPRLIDTTTNAGDPPAESVSAPITSLDRAAVDATVEASFPRFLQKVSVRAYRPEGSFVGWEILAFRNPSEWEGVGLLVGDVVLSVNHMPIERDTQAYQVFMSMKEADAVEVEYLRNGHTMHLAFPIIDRSSGTPPSAASDE